MHKNGWLMRKKWVLLSVLTIVCTMASHAMAQEPRVLGLTQLIQMALDRSPELKFADQDIAAAMSDLAQAKAAQWAQLDVTAVGGVVNDAKKPVVVVSPRPGPDGLLRGSIDTDNDASGLGPFGKLEFTIFQPLYTFGKIAYRKEAAADAVGVQQAAREKTRGSVILKVHELYFALLLAQQGKATAADITVFVEDTQRRIKRLLAVHSPNVDQSDLYRLEAYAAEAKRFQAKAESGTNLAYFALKQLIGLPGAQEFVLDVKEIPRDSNALESQQHYIEQALQSRPEFAQLDKGLEVRHNLLEAAKADLYPSIFASAIGSLAGAPDRQHLDNPYISDEFNHTRVGVVVGAKWHFDLGLLQGRVSKANAEYQRLLQAREIATLNIPVEVAKFYQEAMEHVQASQASEQAAVAARKWIVVAFSNFDIGVGSAGDIFVAIERYGRNRGDYLTSLFNYHLALARLSYAIGENRGSD